MLKTPLTSLLTTPSPRPTPHAPRPASRPIHAPTHCDSSERRIDTDVELGKEGKEDFLLFILIIRFVDELNADCMKLLLQGMPLPSSYGFPKTDGSFLSNWLAFCLNNHPLFSAFFAHPLHPFTRFERLFVYICSVIFSWILNTYVSSICVSFRSCYPVHL